MSYQRDRAFTAAVIDLGVFRRGIPFPPASASARLDAPHPVSSFAERRLGGQPLAVRMARRLSECQWIDEIFAVGCRLPASVLREYQTVMQPISLPDCHVIQRLGAVVDRTAAEWIVYVPANRPFVDASLIDGLLARAARSPDCDYLGYASDSAGYQRMQHLGLAGEVCHADMLRRLRRNADRLVHCDSIAECLDEAPGEYRRKFVSVPRELDRGDLRFAIEYESDWDDAQLLCDSVSDVDADWQRVAELVVANESLRTSMRDRNA